MSSKTRKNDSKLACIQAARSSTLIIVEKQAKIFYIEFVPMNFEIIGKIEAIETIAVGNSIRDIARLRKQYGQGRWRKLKGKATVRLANGRVTKAEIHWYEAHGIGKKKFKIKRYLD